MTTRTLNFLPDIFKTPANRKFLNSTLDQLVTEPDLRKLNGYVGRKFAPTYKQSDNYLIEDSADRQNYQLEPCIVSTDANENIQFLSSYTDIIQKLKYYGGIANNHSRLFANEAYSFDGLVDFDKLVNFSQYYWIPNGPDPVDVFSTVDLEQDFVVTRDKQLSAYTISGFGTTQNPDLILARGGKYTFTVNQPGDQFWIQTVPGLSGTVTNQANLSSRSVYGVADNGAVNGTVTFEVPTVDEQDYFLNMPKSEADFATTLNFVDIHHQLLQNLTTGIDGITTGLSGKTIVFAGNDFSDTAWENKGVYALKAYDNDTNLVDNKDEDPYDEGATIPVSKRAGVWRINLINADGNQLIDLSYERDIDVESRVLIGAGNDYANVEFYKNTVGDIVRAPIITATLKQLYYNDGQDQRFYGRIILVDPLNVEIDVGDSILGKKAYTSPNGVVFTNGLKVRFNSSATPEKYAGAVCYVEGVGTSIRLPLVKDLVTPDVSNASSIPFDVYGFSDDFFDESLHGPLSPDYISINRSSIDANSWSRSNRWFHNDVISATAKYNNVVPVFDQSKRAARPIIEFDADLQLFNYGVIGKHTDVLDFTITDAFNEVELADSNFFKTANFRDGMRIIFANDNDPIVRNQIFKVNVLKINGESKIHLTEVEGGQLAAGDSIIPINGCTVLMEPYDPASLLALNPIARKMSPDSGLAILPLDGVLSTTIGLVLGYTFWYDGSKWIQAQHKDGVNCPPLFDIFDEESTSFADASTYVNSTFAGSTIFSYKVGTGVNDPVLGFPISYRNFNNVGDIEFENTYDSDTFTELVNKTTVSHRINIGTPRLIVDREEFTNVNIWTTVAEKTKQYQIISNVCDGTTSYFEIDILPAEQQISPNIKVFVNNVLLEPEDFSIANVGVRSAVLVSAPLALNDKVDILIYSLDTSNFGYYEVPQNLDFNPLNENFTSLTLGQFRNHLIAMSNNNNYVVGQVPGASNLRDINVKESGGSILQHSAPSIYSSLFLIDKDVNFIDSITYAQHEYQKFKTRFLESAVSAINNHVTDPKDAVDFILHILNEVKNISSPWYYSDMVPYDQNKTEIEYTVLNIELTEYEIDSIFVDTELSNKGILVYRNGVQMLKDIDYSFNQQRPSIIFKTTFDYDDIILIRIYHNTDGCYIPETPSKLGLYPKFTPEVYVDSTYQTPVEMIRGHDGSLTPKFGDLRDGILLELEKRIYNNIKVSYNQGNFDINDVIPGKFRDTNYSIAEYNQIVSRCFLNWVSTTRIDYATNEWFTSNNPWTWNYRRFNDVSGEQMIGFWRGAYKYFYDTDAPHTRPWECLGFSQMPDWWVDTYGPAPYTGGNLVLWGDLEQGLIRFGDRAGVDLRYARPGLSSVIPVTDSGELKSPNEVMTKVANAAEAAGSFTIGDQGPVETAWRNSSAYPFAVQQAISLMVPARYFAQLATIHHYEKDAELNQFVQVDTKQRITPTDFIVNSAETRNAGYVNWIADYVTSYGSDPVTKIKGLLDTLSTRLGYKAAGFTDKNYLRVLAEQSSPGSTNDSIIVPNENYIIHLHKSTPVDRIVYSAVIIEKTVSGYSVSGYNSENPIFTIIPSDANSNQHTITVGESSGVIYNNYQSVKVTVPYGYEFRNKQQIVDFLISYGRFLQSQGFVFEEFNQSLGEPMNWELAAKEFLTWTEQGWAPGNIIVVSPVANTINVLYEGAVVDKVANLPLGSKVLDVGFNIVSPSMFNITRESAEFSLVTESNISIGLLDINLVQYEHVLVFDNTTMFNDIIYKPSLGNRQYRLKLIGNKTASWDGQLSAPGFVFNNNKINNWNAGQDYRKGELVAYKTMIYTALQFVIASDTFNYSQWQQVEKDSIKSGMLPNFAYNAKKFENMYDVDNQILDQNINAFSNGLLGYRERAFLSDLSVNPTSQAKFYQGYIRDKGTKDSIDALSTATFNNLQGNVQFNEEWAFRVGEYGATESNQYVEVQLSDEKFIYNPIAISFLTPRDPVEPEIIRVYKDTLYKKTLNYKPEIFATRNDDSIYENDIRTAGFVNINDIDATIFDISDASNSNLLIPEIHSGFKLWVAKDVNKDWNVFRIDETALILTDISYALDGLALFTVTSPHQFLVNDLIAVRNFSTEADGFYRVKSIEDIDTILVEVTSAFEEVLLSTPTLEGNGTVFKLQSVKFNSVESLISYSPNFGWRTTDRVWIDDPLSWKVLAKTETWQYNYSLPGVTGLPGSNYGQQVAISRDGRIVFSTAPGEYNNNVKIVVQLANGQFENSAGISFVHDDNVTVGNVLAVSDKLLAVLAESTDLNLHKVMLYQLDGANVLFNRSEDNRVEVITNCIVTGTDVSFGTSIAINDAGTKLFVSEPSSKSVYCYNISYTLDPLTYKSHITPTLIDVIDETRLIGLAVGDSSGFGNALSTNSDGSMVVIGASRANTTTIGAGAVYPFRWDTNKFVALPRIAAPIATLGGKFGHAVQFRQNGKEIIVGAPNISLSSYKHGVVFRFVFVAGVPSSTPELQYDHYKLVQEIRKPFAKFDERFGTAISADDNTNSIIISSQGAYAMNDTVIDDSALTFDGNSTIIVDRTRNAGAVYVYDLMQGSESEWYCFSQALSSSNSATGDNFGTSISLRNGVAMVGAPNNSYYDNDDNASNDVANVGAVLWFENATKTSSWQVLRKQQETVDLDNVTRLYLYNRKSQSILTTLDYIDPAKGKILGLADQDISFKTTFDPAIYNSGSSTSVTINPGFYWAAEHIGKVWWNLDTICYVDYEQDSIAYRNKHWGRLFPGSTVEVLEWVESSSRPSAYTGDGVPKYADDSAYVVHNVVDPFTGIVQIKYYFWVQNKTTIPAMASRRASVASIADMIAYPDEQNIPYAAILKNNSISLFNAESYISADDTILHIDYSLLADDNVIHNEYELVSEGSDIAVIPTKINNKLVDSLLGSDKFGNQVPDYSLGASERYGTAIRPRQTMIINRLTAVKNMCQFVNDVFLTVPVAEEFNLSTLYTAEPAPAEGSTIKNPKTGVETLQWNIKVETLDERSYYDPAELIPGQRMLVMHDADFNNQWSIYLIKNDKTFALVTTQSYYTPDYWEKIDWYDSTYDPTIKPTYTVPTYKDISKLTLKKDNSIRVTNNGDGRFAIYRANSDALLTLVGVQEGTIRLKDSSSSIGFGNDNFDTVKFDMNPDIELRIILNAIKNDIFKGTLDGQYNKMFFMLLNYILSEQRMIDWAFKTSFVSVLHKLRKLEQFPNYIKDNQSYYEDYINEVKPYHTKIREYIIDYEGLDNADLYPTDFDLPSYYDTDLATWRSPNGEHARDDTLLATDPRYTAWVQNHGYLIQSIQVTDKGFGYTMEATSTTDKNAAPSPVVGKRAGPRVTVWDGDVQDTTADLEAVVDFYTGSILKVIVHNPGKIHYSTPTIKIEGDGVYTSGPNKDMQSCVLYPKLVNATIRSFDTKVKFDRITYDSPVKQWAKNISLLRTDIVSYQSKAYVVNSTSWQPETSFSRGSIVSLGDDLYITVENVITGSTFNSDEFTPFTTGTSFIPSDYVLVDASTLANAADRTMALYTPSIGMPPKELARLFHGTEYPGNTVDGSKYIDDIELDTNIQSFYNDIELGTRPEDIDIDGGAYIDIFSSHAPEELIPGRMYDTLDMKVFTIDPNDYTNDPIGYRISKTMANEARTAFDVIKVPSTTYVEYPSVIDSTRFDYGNAITWQADTAYAAYTIILNPADGKKYSVRPTSGEEYLLPAAEFDITQHELFTTERPTLFDQNEDAWEFRRISAEATTTLAHDLGINDDHIYVTDVSALQVPHPNLTLPGVIYINGEKISYYTIDPTTNALGRIRRGVWGTGAPLVHLAGTRVVDAGRNQTIPGDATYSSWLRVGVTTPVYGDGLRAGATEQSLFLMESPSYLPAAS